MVAYYFKINALDVRVPTSYVKLAFYASKGVCFSLARLILSVTLFDAQDKRIKGLSHPNVKRARSDRRIVRCRSFRLRVR